MTKVLDDEDFLAQKTISVFEFRAWVSGFIVGRSGQDLIPDDLEQVVIQALKIAPDVVTPSDPLPAQQPWTIPQQWTTTISSNY